MPSDQILQSRCATFVGYVRNLDTGGSGQHKTDKVRWAARHACQSRMIGIDLAPFNEFGERLYALWYGGSDIEGKHRLDDRRDRRQIAQRIVTQLPKTVRKHRDWALGGEQQSTPVRIPILDMLDRKSPGCTWLVFDDYRRRMSKLQVLSKDASDDIRGASWWKSNNYASDLPVRLGMCRHGKS